MEVPSRLRSPWDPVGPARHTGTPTVTERSGRSSKISAAVELVVPAGRVRRCCRQHPLPSELHGHLSTHAAQALNNAPARYDRAGSAGPRHPLRDAVCPIGLGVNLDVTAAVPATEMTSVAGAAPARSLRSRRQICFAPCAGWLTVHVRQHPREVGPLSRGVMSPGQPLSGPLQAGLRFLPRPLPAAPSARLAARLPSREDYGLTTLHRRNPRGLGPASTPVARHLRRMSLEHPDLATYLLVQAYQHLWLVSC